MAAEECAAADKKVKGMKKYVIALDAGTTSVRAMLFDLQAKKFTAVAKQEVEQSFPHPGWVEQDANEIYFKAAYALNRCITAAGADAIAGIGIANQRESVVFWNRETGEPVCPAIIWQCRRTSEFCERIPQEVKGEIVRKTGLRADAYFSASKINWGLAHVEEARRLSERGKLCVGTIDSYLIFKLTEGHTFATDYTNASRTMLFDIHALRWDEELLNFFGVPRSALPEARSCTARMGEFRAQNACIPIAGVAGDQQAALFGQACLNKGDGKITYGTGLFMLFNTGSACARSESGLLSTVGYAIGDKIVYALVGSVFNAGSSIQWLRDEMGFFKDSAQSESIALSVPDSGGVFFVPAFTGLGAPYWRGDARGLLCGITRGTSRAHIVRAVLESIAYSACDLSVCMQQDSGIPLNGIRCDGGASANDFLMQFQADVLGVAIDRPRERESTALGAALLCAVALGLADETSVSDYRVCERKFTPAQQREDFLRSYSAYKTAVNRALFTGK